MEKTESSQNIMIHVEQVSDLAARLGACLRKRGMFLSVAESCTGGLVGHLITDIPGSSEYFLGGAIAYSYEFKETVLGVNHATLIDHGAVSQETAVEMARGARLLSAGKIPSAVTLGLAITGIAGPGGGMPDKPVGLVWIALCTPTGEFAHAYQWQGDRYLNKLESANAALQMVWDYLNHEG